MDNQHLSLFRFYAESPTAEAIENNITRALAICLRSEPTVLLEFLRILDIAPATLFGGRSDFDIGIEIQRNCTGIDPRDKILAVALTPQTLDSVLPVPEGGAEAPVTDILLEIGPWTIIIEVKRVAEDCRQQLANQVAKVLGGDSLPVKFKPLTWSVLLEALVHIQQYLAATGRQLPLLDGLLELIEYNNPDWMPIAPLAGVPFALPEPKEAYIPIAARIEMLKLQLGPTRKIGNRIAVQLNQSWVSEAHLHTTRVGDKDYLAAALWVADTKGQGHFIFNGDLSWTKLESVTIGKKPYSLQLSPYIKFGHFNGSIAELYAKPDEVSHFLAKVHTPENYREYSGRWSRASWNELESELDKLLSGIDWRSRAGWAGNFVATERSYVTIAFGFRVELLVPYTEAQELDSFNSLNGTNLLVQLMRQLLNDFGKIVEPGVELLRPL